MTEREQQPQDQSEREQTSDSELQQQVTPKTTSNLLNNIKSKNTNTGKRKNKKKGEKKQKKREHDRENDNNNNHAEGEEDTTGNRRDSHFIHSFCISLKTILAFLVNNVFLFPIRYTIASLLTHTLASITALVLLLSVLYLLGISLSAFFLSYMTLPHNPLGLLASSLSTLTTPIVYLYCTTLHGPFCGQQHGHAGDMLSPEEAQERIAQLARTVTGTAQKAADIFDSVVQLSDPSHLGLHQAEILELSFAIRWSSDLADKDLLSHSLSELSDLSRDLKDQLINLNGQGLNTFSFIAYEFSRLGDLIDWVQSGEKKYTSETISKNLDILFRHLSSALNDLLQTIEGLIPLASRSTNLGIKLSERLHQEHYQLENKKTSKGLWNKLRDLTSFSGHQLNRDLALTSESIKNLKITWFKLEEIRTDLLTYRNNVANFKASFTGWHLADHQLSPEDELFSMRQVIAQFQLTINQVKSHSRSSSSSSSSSDTESPLLKKNSRLLSETKSASS
ncbi:hypothetical protein PCANC_24859 [Puccinia coronata f. sp. avenae]|uniref:Uncharacterized protein n=1 Tax=Puccinia coronata f. sp. avenae TaxID=200324 RepID=A0A2N5S451_9BASI|nr:hypothetical protein PCANC_24859 [Puccinia coronata f. sp. avenae]